ncbi:MAG: hypothetical protein CO002_02185 [Candidatus Portnoybacteria bacterium CG_4_8_14_3_um_filter_44_10]|uniref:DUF5666 domain-containing protein n=1 Tax=Candidatus Portnoybacteria bacterium CG_4_8_14_3_um_filter_44_10 TaxID=1974802 RepID=A0A2M7IFV8_9BACT|nr:MAG: hypothetical protein CO002_02185 [Candidatus Portnoybacteria bacterium CG_4_8_14_3_um_filter_44_10]
MNNKTSIFLSIIITAVIVGGGAFYGGIKYNQSKSVASLQNLQNMSAEQRQQAFGQMRNGVNSGGTAGTARVANGGQGGGGFVKGSIISKDDKSVTVELSSPTQNAGGNATTPSGSKIVLLSDSTEITKSAAGSVGDLQAGQQISVNGTQNQDGSITASSIQISPTTK